MQMIAPKEAHEESQHPVQTGVLVVGYGFMGRYFAEKLAEAGLAVTVLSRRDPGEQPLSADLRVIVGDAGDPLALTKAMDGVGHVVWCAGGLMPNEAEMDPQTDRERTLGPLQTMVSLDEQLAGKSVTYISSGGTIYGNPGPSPVSEDQPLEPIGAYGRNKVLAERLLLKAAETAGFRLRILRCANVYGPGQPSDRSQGAVAVFTDRIIRELPIDVFGDGGIVRDYVHVDDVVQATVRLWEKDGPVVLNCGSGRPETISGLIEALETALGKPAIVEHRPARGFDVDSVVLDLTKIRALIDFDPVDLETGLGASRALNAR